MEESQIKTMEIRERNFALYISETLDILGYSFQAVQRRQCAWKVATSGLSKTPGPFTYIHAGSAGEGVTQFTKSDLDVMAVNKHVFCSEARVNDPRLLDQITSVLVEKDLAPPGYCRLKVLRFPGGVTFIQKEGRIIINSICTDPSGQRYISSDRYFEICVANHPRQLALPRQGPSSPSKGLGIMQDLVYCFACRCPSILNAYIRRRRCHQWPAVYVLRKIATLDGHVVPVGSKVNIDSNYLEWRICYTLAELALVHSFNETQIKVYVLLKMLSKSVFHQFKDVLTSYLFKNVIFWVSELIPESMFSKELLLDRLIQCFIFLSVCLKRNFFPNYMIPERNLLLNKMSRARRAAIQDTLDQLIAEGGSMVFRCANIQQAMVKLYLYPEMVHEEGKLRDNKELNVIAQSNSQRNFHITSTKPALLGMTIPIQWSHIYQNHNFSAGSVMQMYTGNMPKPEPEDPNQAEDIEEHLDKDSRLLLNDFKILATESMSEHFKTFQQLMS